MISRLPFEVMLALRYLRPKRTFVSVITLISIIGVMLGVAVLIIVISVMAGFDRQLRDKILGFSAHIRIQTVPAMTEYAAVMDIISSNALVIGVAPYVMGRVMTTTQSGRGSELVDIPVIRGIDPRLEKDVSVLMSKIVEGTNDVRGNGVLVGYQFARKMKIGVGDQLAVYSIRDFKKLDEILKKNRGKQELEEGLLPTEYEVRGIFDVGYYEFDDSVVVCSLANAQDIYGLEESVHGLTVMLRDPAQAQKVRAELESCLGREYEIGTWEEENSAILDALIVEKNVMFYLLFFIMIVAAFGITSALITFVVQKTREIGILKALGSSSRQVMWIFLSQSLLVGIVGVTAGFGLGMLALAYRNEFLFFMRRVTGKELFPERIYQFTQLPSHVDYSDIAVICGGSLVICLLAGLFPAWNAGRLKPVEALRHE
jgi:lipoprotein-releasing system permease protein